MQNISFIKFFSHKKHTTLGLLLSINKLPDEKFFMIVCSKVRKLVKFHVSYTISIEI